MKTSSKKRLSSFFTSIFGWRYVAVAMLFSLLVQPALAQRETTYLHTDALGSVVAASSESGALLWRKQYSPYGERTDTNVVNEKLSFTGKPVDPTGLTYYGARYYDAEGGRFLAVDPADVAKHVESNPAMFNRYAYANNNPYRYVDPDGESPVHIAKFALDLSLNIAINYATTGQAGFASAMKDSVEGLVNPLKTIQKIQKLKKLADKSSRVAKRTGGESAAAARGREAHKNYENTLGGEYEFNKALPSGKRPDAIDVENKIVRELKPDNPRAIKRGEKQLEGYRQEAEKEFGGQWKAELDTYKQ